MFNEQGYQQAMENLAQQQRQLSTLRALLSGSVKWDEGHSLLLSTENDAYQMLVLLKRVEANMKMLQASE